MFQKVCTNYFFLFSFGMGTSGGGGGEGGKRKIYLVGSLEGDACNSTTRGQHLHECTAS